MKEIFIIILLFLTKQAFAQPLTSTPAGCAITINLEYRVYQITAASYMSKPTYTGTGGVRYTTWTTSAGVGVDKTRLTCLTLNTGAANTCYVKTGTGTTAADYTSGVATTFTVNSGTAYNESGIGTCRNVPLDSFALFLVFLLGFTGFTYVHRHERKISY
ncbi:hypothetical protein GCM10022246_31030 [Pedobacter ginsengiterrae]|uniref:IPTL-CTERM protein sorting domain-containing protein n=1 Tax=Pedobacter ginsengiterrae TaxID=871696 RepID=A0ABP7Q7S4_9SPHI